MDNGMIVIVTLQDVRAACDTVLAVVGRECDDEAARAAYYFAEDVLAVLRGEWTGDAPEPVPAGDDPDRLPF